MYGPVRTVVWEGSSRTACPYPDFKVVPGGTHRVYVAVIPIEHCEPVYQYISEYAQVPAPNAGDPLILTAVQAKRVIDAAYGFVAPHQHPQLTEHVWEKSNAN